MAKKKTSENKGKRWYDGNPALSGCIEKLKTADREYVERLMTDIENIVMKHDASLFDKHVMEFDIKRRWYDKNPYTWIIINSLRYASADLIDEVVAYLKKETMNLQGKKPFLYSVK